MYLRKFFSNIVDIHLKTYTTQQIHAEKFGESAVLDGVCDGHGIGRHNARRFCIGSTEYTHKLNYSVK